MFDDLRLICFDLDDTLWECAPVIRRAEQELFDWLKHHYPRITARFSQMGMREVRMQWMQQRPELCHDLTRLRIETLRWHARLAGYPTSLAEAGFEVFIEARNRVELYADVEPALRRLGRHYRLAALTNGNASVQRIGIGHYFEAAVSAADAGASKPAPDMFHAVGQQTGIPMQQILHVGDDPRSDILGAHNAGVASVWINRNGQPWDPKIPSALHEIRDLEQLVSILNIQE